MHLLFAIVFVLLGSTPFWATALKENSLSSVTPSALWATPAPTKHSVPDPESDERTPHQVIKAFHAKPGVILT